MKQPDNGILRRIVRGWLDKARQDMLASKTLLAASPELLYPACFHAQQAAEKYLKAFLARYQVEFPKTHSIRELLDLVAGVDVQLADELEAAVVLTPYGVVVRYPGDMPEPLEDDAREAIAMADLVAEKVQERLSGSG